MQKCKELAELYGAYVYGDTTEDETLRVLEHLRDCEECRNDVKMRELTLTLIPNTAPKLSSEDRQHIALSVKQKLANGASRRSWWQAMMPAVRSLSLAATVVIIFAGGAMFGIHMTQQPENTPVSSPEVHHEIGPPAPNPVQPREEQPSRTDTPVSIFSPPPSDTDQIRGRASSSTGTFRGVPDRRVGFESDWRTMVLEQFSLVPDQNANDLNPTEPRLPDALSGFEPLPQINKDAIPGTLERIWPAP